MPIAQYDRLSADDQARYVTLLYSRTIAYLHAQGRNEDAGTLARTVNGDDIAAESVFNDNLETAKELEKKTGKTVDVEYAMQLTLKDLGIDVPESVLKTLARDFVATGTKAVDDTKAPPPAR